MGRRQVRRERPVRRPGRGDNRLDRAVQLRLRGRGDPDPQRGGARHDQPGQHLHRPDQAEPRAESEPDKYYPTGERNYARVIVADDQQGQAGASLMADEGVESVYILDDKETYGKGRCRPVPDRRGGPRHRGHRTRGHRRLGRQLPLADEQDRRRRTLRPSTSAASSRTTPPS